MHTIVWFACREAARREQNDRLFCECFIFNKMCLWVSGNPIIPHYVASERKEWIWNKEAPRSVLDLLSSSFNVVVMKIHGRICVKLQILVRPMPTMPYFPDFGGTAMYRISDNAFRRAHVRSHTLPTVILVTERRYRNERDTSL